MASVFSPSTSIAIAASSDRVFELLTDRTTWPTWNPFIPRADLLPSTTLTPTPSSDDDGHLKLHQRLQFTVQAPIFGRPRIVPGGSVEKVSLLETPGADGVYRVGWVQDMMPAWLMRTLRVNEIVEEEADEDGEARCTYRTYMTFDGPFAWIVKFVVGAKVQEGLELWAKGLKDKAEGR
ncbi:uncharacterized protein K452DRAFT_288462 [Aplosporella prunicola CBS 121167]|uniref:Coenzyme Q-binding protein COQ10 START domain-containing protein n=1 Tax=Aplosporella prunicola CBS 121167 TaxID=1176127 RepID=A0A6A6BCS5_9PEZI|nr:uncharacterized protein K452DRAFT_288462 [Aplosporella prunicola CBS 121167]KAF2141085.1 hypothetical protein K452DRAFT_288462 [Aplosporella prunicola CBS 121167]